MTLDRHSNHSIEIVTETGSTNADLKARLLGGERLAEGDWLVADRQTAGKGRQGREWFDGAGNFMGSTVVHRRAGDPPPASLALMAGLAVHQAVTAMLPPGISARLKWPNDLLIGRGKLAGILLEAVGDSVVVGLGVNLAQAPDLPDRETASLASLGVAVERDRFSRALAESVAQELIRWRDFGIAPIVSRWLTAAHPLGEPLRVVEPGEAVIEGAFAGLTDDGALQLRLRDGTVRVIHAGDVHLAGQP